MRRLIITTICVFQILNCTSQDIRKIRSYYLASSEKEIYCDSINTTLKDIKLNKDYVLSGYQGVYYIMKCNFIKNPFSKITYFNKGKKVLETCIKKNPNSIELRALRYSIQNQAPSFLLYNQNTKEDLAFINKNKKNIKELSLLEYINTILTTTK